VNELLLGAAAMGFFVAGVFFLHYGLATRDRFFYLFTAAFWIEAGNRVHIAMARAWAEDAPEYYYVRLLAYVLILLAIWDKNRRR
jgi:hypothetical protein